MEIVICDDDELFNEIMSEKLSTVLNKNQIKYNITTFFNGSELITALNDSLNRFDVVFLDVDMPGVNGENIAQYINSSKASIPVIFVTNYDDFVFSSFKYRPFGFLRKSHVDSELEEAVIRLDNYLSKSGQCYTFTFQGKLISLPYKQNKVYRSIRARGRYTYNRYRYPNDKILIGNRKSLVVLRIYPRT